MRLRRSRGKQLRAGRKRILTQWADINAFNVDFVVDLSVTL